jgi:AraC-like DNA-binding protein
MKEGKDSSAVISARLAKVAPPQRVRFLTDERDAPDMAYCVNFPRLERVLEGRLTHRIAGEDGEASLLTQTPDMLLYILPGAWNEPVWDAPVTTLSLLIGPQRFGFSLMHWDGTRFECLDKRSVDRRGPRTGAFILQALNELIDRQADQQTAALLAQALLSHAVDLLKHPPLPASRGATLFQTIRTYVDQHFAEPLTRSSVSAALRISPDHLSHVFQKEANTRFNDYLSHVRLEHAKDLLKRHDMKIKEVARRSGFSDSDYFCRLFRQKTQRSPSEYRAQYRSRQASAACG